MKYNELSYYKMKVIDIDLIVYADIYNVIEALENIINEYDDKFISLEEFITILDKDLPSEVIREFKEALGYFGVAFRYSKRDRNLFPFVLVIELLLKCCRKIKSLETIK